MRWLPRLLVPAVPALLAGWGTGGPGVLPATVWLATGLVCLAPPRGMRKGLAAALLAAPGLLAAAFLDEPAGWEAGWRAAEMLGVAGVMAAALGLMGGRGLLRRLAGGMAFCVPLLWHAGTLGPWSMSEGPARWSVPGLTLRAGALRTTGAAPLAVPGTLVAGRTSVEQGGWATVWVEVIGAGHTAFEVLFEEGAWTPTEVRTRLEGGETKRIQVPVLAPEGGRGPLVATAGGQVITREGRPSLDRQTHGNPRAGVRPRDLSARTDPWWMVLAAVCLCGGVALVAGKTRGAAWCMAVGLAAQAALPPAWGPLAVHRDGTWVRLLPPGEWRLERSATRVPLTGEAAGRLVLDAETGTLAWSSPGWSAWSWPGTAPGHPGSGSTVSSGALRGLLRPPAGGEARHLDSTPPGAAAAFAITRRGR